ncbi:Azurin precursor [Luteitalea pratensis]|uniref:Azurin n=1 Tax=Luteitalea pratensis TaxID=1855912 RepID=A0A143PKM0_LUTPR|nr:plastocyanin/azurin family copper-binding protein [Luteitalea pratensis]AMY08803.1 Azurin precursor [Luteitalea pratensis]
MTRYFALLALLISTAVAGCSAPTEKSDAPAPAATAPSSSSSAPANQVHDGRAIEITGNDTMKFSVTEIVAKPGEKLSVTLVNIGTTPKFSMGHNWLLLASGVDIQPFLVASAEAVTTDYVPRATNGGKILAATKLLGPKERDTVTFTAPTTPGRYEFLCSFPGHYQVGMRGVLIVQ